MTESKPRQQRSHSHVDSFSIVLKMRLVPVVLGLSQKGLLLEWEGSLHWLSHLGAVNVYDSIQVTEVIHGHEGKTKIQWIDP